MLFGPALDAATVIVGASVGATAAFVLGRWLGRDRVRRLLGDRLSRADRWFFAVLLAVTAILRDRLTRGDVPR